jgi:hypothetical protein
MVMISHVMTQKLVLLSILRNAVSLAIPLHWKRTRESNGASPLTGIKRNAHFLTSAAKPAQARIRFTFPIILCYGYHTQSLPQSTAIGLRNRDLQAART